MSSDQHKEDFKLKPTPWSEKFRRADEQPLCGPLKFEMYFFPRKRVDLEDISFSQTQIRNFLNSNQGIRIYRDGFRVKPYGEGDWLRLSYRRQQHPSGVIQGNWRVGYNQVVGAVFLERDKNPNLIDQTNREGIVEVPAFYHLKILAEDVIRFFESNRQEFERRPQKLTEYEKVREVAEESTNASLEAVDNLKKTTNALKGILQDVAQESQIEHDLKPILNSLDVAADRVDYTTVNAQEAQNQLLGIAEEYQEDLHSQKDTLGNLASLGILTASFGHETLGASNAVIANAGQLKRNLDKGLFMVAPDVRQTVEENLNLLVSSAGKINNFAKFALKNINRDKRKRKEVDISSVVREVFRFFANPLEERNINVELNLPEKVSPILAFEIDWESIFVNLITNAVWALEDTEAAKREIRVSIWEAENHLEITFADSGCGLEAGTADKIFLPTFSTKRNEQGEIIGTGLGLTIVKGFVEDYKGGSIQVGFPCDLDGAQFHIRIPVPNLESRRHKKRGNKNG